MKLDKKKKTVEAAIQYRNLNQLKKALNRIYELAQQGVNEYKQETNEFNVDFCLRTGISEEYIAKARTEEIDGKICMIIPSKMNENWKIN
jgi:hypothetical protein